GVDRAHFRAPRPSGALAALGCRRPIVGFFGGLDDYVIDFDLLERLAVERPGYTLVLIGDATLPLERLTRHPNVRHLGFRPYAEIPALGADFDVAIMPWLDNEWIRCCNPIKLKEYLALGLEVVTTPFPEVEHYRDFVHVAERGADFLRPIDDMVEGARAPPGPPARPNCPRCSTAPPARRRRRRPHVRHRRHPPFRRPARRRGAAAGDGGAAAAPRTRRRRLPGARRHRLRPRAPVDHRRPRLAAADALGERSGGDHVQRRDLQLPGPAPRPRGARRGAAHARRHRGAARDAALRRHRRARAPQRPVRVRVLRSFDG